MKKTNVYLVLISIMLFTVVKVSAENHTSLLTVKNIEVPAVFYGSATFSGTLQNTGQEFIHSFDLNWQINDGEYFTKSYSGLDLSPGDIFQFESDDHITASPGSYQLNVFISGVNNIEPSIERITENYIQPINIAYREVDRRPLFEMFTSSTCPPCAPFNINFFNGFSADNAEDLTVIKYQMNWPGAGDPYYTPEGGTRRLYYGINAVPSVVLDGSQVAANASAVTNAFQSALQVPAFVDISGNYEVEGDNIIIEGSVMPYTDFSNVRLHVVVIESVTYGNTGGNGETEFHYVMHKMLPNAQGTSISLTSNEAYEFSHNFDMSNTNVEEMDDLMVVVFLQNHATKEVHQSNLMDYGIIQTFSVTFDVVNENGEPINNATISLGDHVNNPGDYTFEGLAAPRNYNYSIQRECYLTVNGVVSVIDEDVFLEVELPSVPGDANGDGVVNVLDIILIANYFTGTEIDKFCFDNADVNQDGIINALDLILTVSIFSE